MSVSLLLPDITDAIHDLDISGVEIVDFDGIAVSWKSKANVLYPNPEGFVTNFNPEWLTLLQGNDAPLDVSYTLNYRFLGTQIGDLSNMAKAYALMVNQVVNILNTLLGTDRPYSGKVQMSVGSVTFGARTDPAGSVFHGADIALNVVEMQNAA